MQQRSRRAAAPTSAAPSSRCARSPPCSRPAELAQHGDHALATAGASASTRSRRVSDTVAEQRSAALLERQAGGRLRDRAHAAAPARSRSATACAQALDKLKKATPGHHDHRGVQLRRPGRGELRRLDGAAVRGRRRSRCSSSGCSCATGARRWSSADRAAAVDHPDVLRRCTLLGFTLNIVTLLALSLVVGILVDDAIVEIENIMRHLRMGKTPYQAAMEAADEIGLAVIATTFTLIAVFLPTAFMSGIAGQVLRPVRLDRGDRRVLLAGRRAHADADDGGLHPASRRRRRTSKRRWIRDLHAAGCAGACAHRVVTTLGARRSSSSARSRWCRCCRPASSRPTTCRRRRCTIALPPGSDLRADATPPPKRRAQIVAREPARQAGLHHGRRRRDRRRSVRGRRRRRGAQGDADAST